MRTKTGGILLTHDRDLIDAIDVATPGRLPVLIVGETGTGKELVARLLHERGSRGSGPFVAVNCAALTESLAEVELFGASRGSYTGATRDREGLVAAAHGGTLFLDELPDLSRALQAKLLRLIEDGTYLRVGETRTRRTDARIVAATNRVPEELVSSGRLRLDVLYRLDAHRIRVRPLRERPADIGMLALHFARKAGLRGVDPAVIEKFNQLSWPGNVRELKLLVETAAAHVDEGDELSVAAVERVLSQRGASWWALAGRRDHATLVQIIERHNGNVAAAARELGISRQALSKRLRRHRPS